MNLKIELCLSVDDFELLSRALGEFRDSRDKLSDEFHDSCKLSKYLESRFVYCKNCYEKEPFNV